MNRFRPEKWVKETDLDILRLSLRRVAEIAISQGAKLTIPEPGQERGWNALCADLIGWLEERNG